MPYLPPELWILVVSFINDNHTLANLCQVSQTFKEICVPALYKNPMVEDDHIGNFTRTLIQSSHLARQVKIMDFESDLWWKLANTPLEDMPKEVTLLIQKHTVTLISLCHSLPDNSFRRGLQAFLQRHVAREDLWGSAALYQSMFMSLLPNLKEADMDFENEVLLATVPSGALSRLRMFHINGPWHDDNDRFRFKNLKFLARAATNLDGLLIEGYELNFEDNENRQTSLESFTKFPVFPTVTNLALAAWGYHDLQNNAAEFFLSFPLLQSFRIDGWRNIETPSLPKFKSLLGAIASHAVRIKHLCLDGAITDLHRQHNEMGDECSKYTWTEHLQDITRIETLDTLSIDTWTLWPFKNSTNLPDDLLLHCIPESLRHLHVDGATHYTGSLPVFVDLVDLQLCLLELARALSVGRFRCLRLISFESNDSSEMDLSEAKQALMKVGVSLVQRRGPWREGDGHGLFLSD